MSGSEEPAAAQLAVSVDQLHPRQQPLPDGLPGDRLGEGYLKTAPLRRLIRSGPITGNVWVPDWAVTLAMPAAGPRQ